MVQDNILENIRKKLKDESNCDLTISELEVLSKCDYETIVQIFGKDSVARTPEEITINTICYVGDLDIKELLPTYNLNYIFGNLGIRISNINLDNLKFVRNSLNISRNVNYEELGLDELLDNKSYMLYAVKRYADELGYASVELKNDKEVVLEAVKSNGYALRYASRDLKSDKEVVLEAAREEGFAFASASDELKNDKKYVLEIVKVNGIALESASEMLKKDREVVLEAVRQNGYALQYASNEFQKDKEVVLEAVRQDGKALNYASVELKNDKDIVLEAIKQNYFALYLASEELKNDKDIVLEAVKSNGYALAFASEELKNDNEFVLEAIKQNSQVLKYISEKLRNDRKFILEVVKNGIIPSSLPNKYHDDDEIMFESIKNLAILLKKHYISLVINGKRPFAQYYETVIQSGLAHRGLNMSRKYTSNRESMLEIVKQCGWAYVLVSDNLKNDGEIIYEAIKQDESIKDYLNWTNVDWKSLIQKHNNTNISFKK